MAVICPAIKDLFALTQGRKLSIADIEIRKTVGLGGFGRVCLSCIKDDAEKRPLALKIQSKTQILQKNELDHVKGEKAILSEIEHPFIVNMFTCFQDEYNLYILLEYVNGGELAKQIRENNGIPIESARFYAAEIMLVLEYLHKKDIMYRDLKPENILIDAEGHIKMVDFGVAKKLAPTKNGKKMRRNSFVGTNEYLSPELVQIKAQEGQALGYTNATDWWAFGCVTYEMMTGYPPFGAADEFKLYKDILEGSIQFPQPFDQQAKDMIMKCCPARVITSCCGLITKPAPKQEDIEAKHIKAHGWFAGMDWDALLERKVKPPFVPGVKAMDDTSMFSDYEEVPLHADTRALTQEQQNQFEDFGNFCASA